MNTGRAMFATALLIVAVSIYAPAKIMQSTSSIECTNQFSGAFAIVVYDDMTGEILRAFGTDCQGRPWHVEYADSNANRVFFTQDPGPAWTFMDHKQWRALTWFKVMPNADSAIQAVWGRRADGRYYVVQAPLVYSPE